MKTSERAAARLLSDVDEPCNNALYEEYVRGFDEVPVLEDAVIIPPPRPSQPSFVRGERRSARKDERPDGYSLREATVADLEQLYDEYSAPRPKQARASKRTPRKGRRKTG